MMTLNHTGNCPECNSSWRDKKIPIQYVETGMYGRWDGKEERYFSRLIGVEIRGKYDGISLWKCPDCDALFDRFDNDNLVSDARRKEILGE